MNTIHVLIADDAPDFRQHLRVLLDQQEGIEVVGEAVDGQQAVDFVGPNRPEVVLMDIEMPVLDGIEATRKIRRQWPEVHVVPLTIYDRPVFRQAMAEAGASGYVLKEGELSDLVAAIRQAAVAECGESAERGTPDRDRDRRASGT